MLSPPAKVVGHRRHHRKRTSLLHGLGCLEVKTFSQLAGGHWGMFHGM